VTTLLGGMKPAAFLRDHWQKRPLLVRQAIPGFAGIVDRDRFLSLATRTDGTAKLILEHPRRPPARRWERHDGPFASLDASMLPRSHWTLLVHGVQALLPGGWEILREFSFIPTARIDDLMISYAADQGGVGPHDDAYDVFLLQGPGRRRWRVSAQPDREVVTGAAIRVLRDFRSEAEWVLEPGDLLYLPPGVAHWGIAEGPCFTYSIGFLAPTHEALVQNFLGYLGETLGETLGDAIYQDPDLRLQQEPLEIGPAMIDQVARVLAQVRWDRGMVGDFVGRLLTGPKPQVVFAAPKRPLSPEAFDRKLRESRRGRLTLALPSRGLVRGSRLYFNGEAHAARAQALRLFKQLIHGRSLPLPIVADPRTVALLHGWYVAGYLGF
jgi:50S ribosomal protein L16 3-hydroxylase